MKAARAKKIKTTVTESKDSAASKETGFELENNNSKKADLVYLREASSIVENLNPHQEFSPRRVLDQLRTMLACLEEKDAYTHGHSIRVTEYSTVLGLELNFTEMQIEELQVSALLHDIGKVGIPDKVLLKPAPLSQAEFEIMKSHPIRGAKILEKANALEGMILGARHHHERIDGHGYPNGLKGKEIPLIARIILIGDTFDAMTSTRPYRLALSHETAFDELKKYSGSQFDMELVNAFIRGMRDQKKVDAVEKTLLRKIS